MRVPTTRFGSIDIEPRDVLDFPAGLIGLEDCRKWVLLADAHNPAIGWLQSLHRPELAVAVVSPRRFVPNYQVRTPSRELAPLQLTQVREAQVVVIVGRGETGLTLNLKAPVMINLERNLGRQVINNLDEPVAYVVPREPVPMRKSA